MTASRMRKNWHSTRRLSTRTGDGAERHERRARDAGSGWAAGGDVQLRVARATDSGGPSAAADPGDDRRGTPSALATLRAPVRENRPALDRPGEAAARLAAPGSLDRKSTRLNSSHVKI